MQVYRDSRWGSEGAQEAGSGVAWDAQLDGHGGTGENVPIWMAGARDDGR